MPPAANETSASPELVALRRFPSNPFGCRLALPCLAMSVGSLNERFEQWVGRQRFGLELRMELAPNEPWVAFHFHDFHKITVGRSTDNFQSVSNQCFFVLPVEFIAMTMPLRDFHFTVSLLGVRARRQDAGISAQAHRAAEVINAPQLAKLVDYAMLRRRIELGAIRIRQTAHVSGKLNNAALHSQTNS